MIRHEALNNLACFLTPVQMTPGLASPSIHRECKLSCKERCCLFKMVHQVMAILYVALAHLRKMVRNHDSEIIDRTPKESSLVYSSGMWSLARSSRTPVQKGCINPPRTIEFRVFPHCMEIRNNFKHALHCEDTLVFSIRVTQP